MRASALPLRKSQSLSGADAGSDPGRFSSYTFRKIFFLHKNHNKTQQNTTAPSE
jgi:hypothetical protein